MGGSGSWLKSFIPHKKSNPDDREKVGKRSSKWKLWRSSSSIDSGSSVKRGQVAASEPSDFPTSAVNDVYTAAMATLIRAPPKNFLIVRKEWAAIRIQTAFRALLARRALRALKALVRLQAIVRGRLVRKQAAMTLKCMQALVRAQAQIKAHRARISLQGKSLHNKLSNQPPPPPPIKQPQEGRFDSWGNMDDKEVKLQMRKEAAYKKSISQQVTPKKQSRAASDLNPWKKDSFSGPIEIHNLDKSNSEWSSLEEWWVASEPCEDSTTSSPLSPEHEKGKPSSKVKAKSRAKSSNSCGNNTTKRVTARPQRSISYCSSSSSVSSSTTVEGADETASSAGFGYSQPRFMSPTSSKMAKQKAGIKKIHQREALSDWTRC